MQQMDAVGNPERSCPGESFDRRPDRDGAGADHELVVANQFLAAFRVGDKQPVLLDVDPARDGVETQSHPGRLEVGDAAVRKIPRLGHLA